MICQCLFELSALATLAALSRVCKEFENPALDALWIEQSTLLNLINCMPFDLRQKLSSLKVSIAMDLQHYRAFDVFHPLISALVWRQPPELQTNLLL